VIIVDAAVTGAPLGTVHRDVDMPVHGTRPISSHGMSLQDAIELGRYLDRLPDRLTVVGIEARSFEHFSEPESEVLGAVAMVAAEIIEGLAVADRE
jgi:hydrogenase maturation protease